MLNAIVRRSRSRKGFTLLELIVVILIIGILAAFSVPQYMKSLEMNKAEDASALINMVATTNRMYALDHGNAYAAGTITNTCNTAACVGSGNPAAACDLVACKYLAATDFDGKGWVVAASDGSSASACLGTAAGAVAYAGCGRRRLGSDTPAVGAARSAPYTTWAYTVTIAGVMTPVGTGTLPPVPSQ